MYPKEESVRIGAEMMMYNWKGIFRAPRIILLKINGIPGVSLNTRLQAKKVDIFASSGIDIGFLRNKDMNLLITFIPNILATQ